MTMAALFWSWGADEDIIARLVKKTLFVGVFAYIIGNWNALAKIVFESFAGLGLKASGTGFSATDLLRPGRVAQIGLEAGRPILESISGLMGYIAFFENFIQITVLLFAWVMVLLAFFILAIQLFVTLIEFKLTTLAGFVLIPFGLFGQTAVLAERVLGNVVSSGVKVLVLAVVVGIGSTLFAEFTRGFGGNQPSVEDAMAIVLAALSLLGLGIFGPGIANGLISGGPQLGAGSAIGTGLAAGGAVMAGGAAAGMAARGGNSTRRDRRRGARRRGHRWRRGNLLRDRISRTERHGRHRIGSRWCRARRRWCSRTIGEARGGLGRGDDGRELSRRRENRRRSDGRHIDHGHDRRECGERRGSRHVLSTRMGAAHEAPPDHESRRQRRCPRRQVRRQPRWRRLRFPPSG
jgi:P-type conjugative transfer protein TrbL